MCRTGRLRAAAIEEAEQTLAELSRTGGRITAAERAERALRSYLRLLRNTIDQGETPMPTALDNHTNMNRQTRAAYLHAASDYVAEVMADLNTRAAQCPRCGVNAKENIAEHRAFRTLGAVQNRLRRVAATEVCGPPTGDPPSDDADLEELHA